MENHNIGRITVHGLTLIMPLNMVVNHTIGTCNTEFYNL